MIAPGTGVRVYLACGVTDTLLIVRHLHTFSFIIAARVAAFSPNRTFACSRAPRRSFTELAVLASRRIFRG